MNGTHTNIVLERKCINLRNYRKFIVIFTSFYSAKDTSISSLKTVEQLLPKGLLELLHSGGIEGHKG